MDKFNDCFELSSQIVDKYTEFINLSLYGEEDNEYQHLVEYIKELVLKEYEIVESMSFKDVQSYLRDIISLGKQYEATALARVLNKVFDRKEILFDNVITGGELGIVTIPKDVQFSTYDSILSMIDIDTIKNIKNKIYSLNVSCDEDDEFVIGLKERLSISKASFLFAGSTAEMLALYHNADIDKIPRIDVNKIKDKTRLLGNSYLSTNVTNVIAVYARKTLDTLSNVITVNNNPKDVFVYLSNITKLEVLLSYMDRNMLNIIYNYCCIISNEKNINSMSNVKRLIKEKLK